MYCRLDVHAADGGALEVLPGPCLGAGLGERPPGVQRGVEVSWPRAADGVAVVFSVGQHDVVVVARDCVLIVPAWCWLPSPVPLVSGLVGKAASMRPPGFVRVDMEGAPYTQRTLDFVHELHRMPGNQNSVGTVIQAYLKRSESDIEKLLSEGIRIRLCKGAYKEPASIAFEKKEDVDANYIRLMKVLMKSGIYHGLATHDEKIIREAQAFAKREGIARESFEFQMLYGIRRDLQQSLVRDGWRMRVYIPFGTEWYPYFMRRLGERPANVIFIARNLLRS